MRSLFSYRAALGLALCLSSSAESGSPPTESVAASPALVEFRFKPVGEVALPDKVTVLLRERSVKTQEPRKVEALPVKPLRLALPAGTSWEVSAEAPGFWIRRQSLSAVSVAGPNLITFDLWPLGTISGSVFVEHGMKLPSAVVVKTLASPAVLKRPKMPDGVLSCPVDPKGQWRCSLPAARYDMIVSASGMTPHYLFGIEVPPHATANLGSVRLGKSGSVAGFVAVEGAALDAEQCVVRVAHLASCDADPALALRIDQAAVEKPVHPDGFFQVAGLEAGLYVVEVRQPGSAPARSVGVQVERDAETFLSEPLILSRPITVEVVIAPPVDELGEPWQAQAFRLAVGDASSAPLIFEGTADEEGRFVLEDQAPGRFRFLILDRHGNRLSDEPEQEFLASARHTLEIRRIQVDGRVWLGEKPLASTLWFGGRSGRQRVKLETDEDGRFSGLLPAPGRTWGVMIEAKEPALSVTTRALVEADSTGSASIEIRLPDTRLFGRVLDPAGKPAPGSMVMARGSDSRQRIEADGQGRFELRGLPAGLQAVLASNGTGTLSEERSLNLVEGQAVGPIELRLRAMRRVSGTVRSSQGLVAGAKLLLRAEAPAIGEGSATSQLDGSFSLELPENLGHLIAVVKAPGFGAQGFRVAGTEDSLNAQVREGQGTISIAKPAASDEGESSPLRLALWANGLELPVSFLRSGAPLPASSATGEVSDTRLPALAPGDYVACWLPVDENVWGGLGAAPPTAGAACAAGTLVDGQELRLVVQGRER